jgi:hypothetical protein
MPDGSPDTIYAWQVFENDEWGTIAASIPGVGMSPVPLLHRSLLMVRRLQPLGVEHGEQTGLPIRLAKFAFESVVDL